MHRLGQPLEKIPVSAPHHAAHEPAMSVQSENPIHGFSGTPDRKHSKDDALSEREFELLLEGARTVSESPYYYHADPEMVIYTLGRLGLRRGELVHLEEDWIDWREQVIRIPSWSPCDRGRDGQVCGECRQSVRQRLEHADADCDWTFDDAAEWMWTPKTEGGVRDVYFGHDTRAQLYLERYFESSEYSRYEKSGSAVKRTVTRAAEEAPELDPDAVYPHALRATAAGEFSSRLDVYGLKQIMGWRQISTSMAYVSSNADSTAHQLDATR
jgi:integrase